MTKNKPSNTTTVTIIICATVVVLCAIGAFVFVSQQNMSQRQKENEASIQAANKDRLIEEYNACISAADIGGNNLSRQYNVGKCREKYQQ